jgi:hypothetical protein
MIIMGLILFDNELIVKMKDMFKVYSVWMKYKLNHFQVYEIEAVNQFKDSDKQVFLKKSLLFNLSHKILGNNKK